MRHVVLDRRMAFVPSDHTTFVIFLDTQRAESDALIEFDVVADDCRLANHHARAVIDEKPFAYCRSRMDVDPRYGFRMLRHDPRQQWNTLQVELMCDAIDGYGEDRRIRKNHF